MSEPPSLPAARVCAVLGMHRSGTSFLAGSLEEKGLALGDVSTEDPHNRRGNREHPDLMPLHDGVFGENDATWKKPPRRRVTWSPAREAALAAFIARMNGQYRVWGFKDPRALLLFAEWRRQVPHLERVGIYRHPLAVHRSLASRNPRFDERRSLKLWKAYNQALVDEHKRAPFPIMRFDVSASRLRDDVERLVKSLDLPDAGATATFFDASLVHQSDAAEEPVPRTCRKLWDYLEAQVGAV